MATLDIDRVINRIDKSAIVARPVDLKTYEKIMKGESGRKVAIRKAALKTQKERSSSQRNKTTK
ncbi:MAG: hypothetical protein FWD38_11385 [Oscillospiraceae bacterium]|nr:hypothetical protein [Oscillospiraceae bacterium]